MTTAAPQPAKTLLTSYDRPPSLDNPRSPRKPRGGNFEKYAWMFMRFSGIVLIFLVIGHMAIMLTWDSGVHRISSCLLYTSPSPRDRTRSRMPSSA